MNHKLHTCLRPAVIALCLGAMTSAAAQTVLSGSTPDGRNVTATVINPFVIKVTNSAAGELELTSNRLASPISGVSAHKASLGDNIEVLSTGRVTVTLDKLTGVLTLDGGDRRVITDNGLRYKNDGRQSLELATTSTGAYYGAGERGHSLDLRGDTLVMYNRQNYGYTGSDPRINQMNITMPLFVSSDGFALVFDDFAASKLILSDPIKYESESPGAISYYYVNGVSTVADAVEQLSAITGRQELPPFYALGYITSKYGYRTQAETIGTIDTLHREGYPVDGIVLDLYWYGNEQDMGRLTWDADNWPSPKKMLADLKKRGVNLTAISQPYVLRNGRAIDNYHKLAQRGLFVKDSVGNPLEVKIWVGEGGMFDVSNPDTRDWLSCRYGELTDMGVEGWWGDLGEPEVHPEGGIHANGLTSRQYHNRYGNDWSKIIHDLFKEKYPDTRLMTLMRGGTTGLQRYSVFPWSTDVSRSWGGLEPQIRIMINSGISGLGYMSHDVGGFAVDQDHPYDAELYVRWLQLGLFSPVLRTHSQRFAEPYNYPDHADIIKGIIKERYRWLPYNYSLAYENATKGWPLVRPLNFHDAGPTGCDTIHDEFLWGRDVLVAPILEQGATIRKIIFPAGQWIDMRNPRSSYSGSIDRYDAALSEIPLFVRAGAFIPMAEYEMRNTGDYDPATLAVNYYPSAGIKSSYTLYDDDRKSTRSLADGQFRLITFDGECDTDGNISIKTSSAGSYEGAPRTITISLNILGVSQAPQSVTIDGKNAEFQYLDTDGGVRIKMKFVPDRISNIKIKFPSK